MTKTVKNLFKTGIIIFIVSFSCIFALAIFNSDNSIARASSIPAPPSSGPKVSGNFIVNGFDPQQESQYQNMQVVSDGTNYTHESMWYKNPVNIKQPFQTKFYIYMSGKADGLTFTLQGQGKNALGREGEGLGAYGYFRQNGSYNGYIQNALSLEFDPYYNGDNSDAKEPVQGAHIAYTYPNNTNAFQRPGINNLWGIYISHYSTIAAPSLNNGKWHSVVVKWTPNVGQNTAKISSTYDGQGMADINVNLSTFGSNDVYWGFTGSTGEQSMLGAVAYTQVIQQPGVQKSVRNITQGETDFKEDTNANYGDIVEYKVQVNNDEANGIGNLWKDATINDKLPDGVEMLDGQKTYQADFGNIPIGGSVTKTFKAKVTSNQIGATLKNTAVANGSNYYVAPVNLESNESDINVVKPSENKNVNLNIKDAIYNLTTTDDHNDDNTIINNVKTGDNVKYVTTVNNSEDSSRLSNGEYKFNIPSDASIKSVYMGTDELTEGDDYTIDKNSDSQTITIKNFNILNKSSVDFTTNIQITKANNGASFKTEPTISGTNTDGSAYTSQADPLTINYIKTGLISIKPKNIDYGEHAFYDANEVINRTNSTNSPQSVVDVTDTRGEKDPVSMTVSQTEGFVNSSGVKLPSQLRYYSGKSYDTLADGPVEIQSAAEGKSLESVIWKQDEGLRLYANGKNFEPGSYKAELNWQVTNSF